MLDGAANERKQVIITRGESHEMSATDCLLLESDEDAWQDYPWWPVHDRRSLRRVNALIADDQRDVKEGNGEPQALEHDVAGWCSRCITDEQRQACR